MGDCFDNDGGENTIMGKIKPDSPKTICGKKYRNPDLLSNLTSKQRYTITNIRNAMIAPKTNQFKSPVVSNLFARIPLTFNSTLSPMTQYTSYRNIQFEYSKREYFGPVSIRKLHIRLLDERGIELNMNGNWSFSFGDGINTMPNELYNNDYDYHYNILFYYDII